MQLSGNNLIAGVESNKGPTPFRAVNPSNRAELEPAFYEATSQETNDAVRAAEKSFDALRQASAEQRATLLENIAEEMEALGDALLERAHQETGLPLGRLTGERGRAVNQTRLFAQMIREGSWVQARVDHGDPTRTPAPKPDVRTLMAPIGPVAVFGASNFPLAISVAGTDTIAALGAGCPVVVKGHPGHPGTSELLAKAITRAVSRTGLPAGCFSLLHGTSHQVGVALVRHSAIQAVAFTGSLQGGRALYDTAAARPSPIPVYAEMGSINPVFVLDGALKERAHAIAEGYLQSVNLGVGQFCTNPGLLLGMDGEAFSGFKHTAAALAQKTPFATMLHPGLCDAYEGGVDRIRSTPGVEVLGEAGDPPSRERTEARCTLFSVEASLLSRHSHLMEEVFGPASIVVTCKTKDEMLGLARELDGHLSATIHGSESDLAAHADLLGILERKVGRLVFNGYPTGIEVCGAMHHGGPYPATTHSFFTSIGTAAIYRFVRPLCYQNFPDTLLPDELKEANPMGIARQVDGVMVLP